MDHYEDTDQAYKNGYSAGYRAGQRSAVGGDVVSVVRCKNCDSFCTCGNDSYICSSWGSWCDPNGWCYKGERRTEDG